MLQKKSEYRIQYCKLNQDLRRRIWQDNIALRKSRLSNNQTTHYWEYQLRDDIDPCDFKDEEEEEQFTDNRSHKLSEVEIAGNTTSTLPDENNRNRSLSPAIVKPRPTSLSRSRHKSPTRPSRTSRKLYAEAKSTHFLPFGWNETNADVGLKQTYNVCAPQKEVHESAVRASRRRKADIERFLAQEKQIKQEDRRQRTCSNSTNHWVSEYQEQFVFRGSSRNSRPMSAPPASRHPVSWRHS